jgi:hypothetical protein
LNPIHWKREHLAAWAVTIVAGGATGMIFGWLVSPFSHLWGADTGTLFLAWLHYPASYCPWVAGGAICGGVAYYSADLLTGAN